VSSGAPTDETLEVYGATVFGEKVSKVSEEEGGSKTVEGEHSFGEVLDWFNSTRGRKSLGISE
jgi:hypothetical protein